MLKFINEIATDKLKVLYSSSNFHLGIFKDQYAVKKVQRLKVDEAVELFMTKIPLGQKDKKEFLDFGQIRVLHETTLERYGQDTKIVAPCKMKHTHATTCVTKYLA